MQAYLRNDFQALHNIWDHLMLQATVFSLSILPASCNLVFRKHFKNSDISSARAAVDVTLKSHSSAVVLHSYLSLANCTIYGTECNCCAQQQIKVYLI